ncbi:cell division FtsA domain-containing protein [Clostridium sp. BL-8]|uniref:cell division FtsA domain-containing protein n=1 Tax=Clostridium sp. BL-8 TaxID=349938 RepID=UPI00098CC4F1|nr:cell division FtsA domain-containing protein [Clostridium sp. BL-8]OOM80370.1 cell division protein FtsA [Clostridium sp. BL-8]
MQQEIITAIDFGTKKMSVTVAAEEDNELEILGVKSCKSVGIEKGLLIDLEKCRDNVITLLSEVERDVKKEIKNLAIGISSNKVRITEKTVSVRIDENKVTSKDLMKALKKGKNSISVNDDESVIDIIINFYILDGNVIYKDILHWKGNDLEVNLTLVIAKTSEIEKYHDLFKGTKYNIQFFKLNILSGKEIFLTENNSMGYSALVDIGAGITDIALFNNGIPKNIDNILVGGNNITNDLSICGKFSFLEADNMKKIYSSNYKSLYVDDSISEEIEVGTIKVPKKLFYEVVEARIEETLSHIDIKIKNTGHYDRICSIILYGDGINYFEDISEIVRKNLKIKTKIIRRNDLGIKNSENITSMAIAKEVYDRLNLLEDRNVVLINNNNEVKAINEKEHLHNNEDENHIFKKVKVFFSKIF